MLAIGRPEADEVSEAVAALWPHAPSQKLNAHRLTSCILSVFYRSVSLHKSFTLLQSHGVRHHETPPRVAVADVGCRGRKPPSAVGRRGQQRDLDGGRDATALHV
jgi:hypothetical protein